LRFVAPLVARTSGPASYRAIDAAGLREAVRQYEQLGHSAGRISALTSDLPNYLPLTREKTDLVRACFADLIASVC